MFFLLIVYAVICIFAQKFLPDSRIVPEIRLRMHRKSRYNCKCVCMNLLVQVLNSFCAFINSVNSKSVIFLLYYIYFYLLFYEFYGFYFLLWAFSLISTSTN